MSGAFNISVFPEEKTTEDSLGLQIRKYGEQSERDRLAMMTISGVVLPCVTYIGLYCVPYLNMPSEL